MEALQIKAAWIVWKAFKAAGCLESRTLCAPKCAKSSQASFCRIIRLQVRPFTSQWELSLCSVELNSVRDNSWKSVWKAWDPVVRPMMSQRTSYTRGWRTHDFHAESIIWYIRPNNALLIMTVQMVCLGCMCMASSIPWFGGYLMQLNWPTSVILVRLALLDNSPGLSTESELALQRQMSVRNSISIVMIAMHNVVKHCYYSLAALVITLGFSENRGKVAAKYVKV